MSVVANSPAIETNNRFLTGEERRFGMTSALGRKLKARRF
jgi:hypothetical protein